MENTEKDQTEAHKPKEGEQVTEAAHKKTNEKNAAHPKKKTDPTKKTA
jgi:hypothetical protein